MIQSEMKELDAKLMSLTNNDKSFEIDRSYLLELASKTRRIFESSKPEKKNKILKLLFSNLEINEKRLNCNLLEPFLTLSNCRKIQFGSGSWARTSDLMVNSHPLYH